MSSRARSNRRNTGNANRIRGPQSALTDFLASHNISANEIRLSHQARQQAAEQETLEEEAVVEEPATAEEEKENNVQAKKRKRKEDKAVEKIKQSKKFQKKRKTRGRRHDDDSDEAEDAAAWDMYSKSKPVPGQLDNCGICNKRFTVTNYSKAGPDGKLLCAKCSKDFEKEDKQNKAKKKQAANGHKRRQMQSNLLDGVILRGAKTLTQLCIQKVVANIHEVEDFGDLPPSLTDELAKIFSKKRVMNSQTIDFFVRPEYETVNIYDAADLTTDDYMRLFAVDPDIKNLSLQNCGQFKNQVLEYITNNPAISIVNLCLGGANLIDDDIWRHFLASKGKHLKSLKLNYIDGHFDDDTFSELVKHCPQIWRLKLEIMGKITHKSIEAMPSLKNLTHLTLRPRKVMESDSFITLLSSSVGPQLRTFCLEDCPDIDDTLLASIHDNCRHLSKLRIAKNSLLTDAAFVNLFKDWENPALAHINLQRCRDVDANNATENENGIGLCAAGFEALMAHSGSRIEYLNVTSNRHITRQAFSNVFDGVKQYPHLQTICVSFCGEVDDTVLAGIFKSCAALKKIWIFGCWDVADPVVPRGVVLLGKPNAQDDLAVEGDGGEQGK
ncbi:MAG: hypothetical protein M1837_006760 [Sclerophora amabilis]|nr:MAG: hypothetical protein M1837_006760 [Sclerophora amabilis]